MPLSAPLKIRYDLAMLPLSPYETKIEIGRMLRAHRLAANLSQRDLGKRAGISEATVKRIEASGTASLEHVLMVAFALGLERLFTELPSPMPRSIDEVIGANTPRVRACGTRRAHD